jgi:Bacterial TSP3 repeat
VIKLWPASLLATAAVVAFLVAGMAAADDGTLPDDPVATPVPCTPGEICSGEGDADWDGFLDWEEWAFGSDPDDAASTPENIVLADTCGDGSDNDADGKVDRDDEGCVDFCAPEPMPLPPDGGGDTEPGVPPIFCDEDSDGDGYYDSEELAWGSDPDNAESTPESWAHGNCDDSSDNDLDGAADALDDACADPCQPPPPDATIPSGLPNGTPGMPYFCDQDSDGDGFYDSEESGAGSDPNDATSTPEAFWYVGTCEDGVDNDGDGLADAADDLCQVVCVYPEPGPPKPDDSGGSGDGEVTSPCIVDADGDDVDDWTEEAFGSDPGDAASTPEHLYFPGSCEDALDNDGDGATDDADKGCQPDSDGDGIADAADNCEMFYNPDQADADNDGTGDACEDSDSDGFFDLDELILGSDAADAGSTPEVFWFDVCEDGLDNDKDGAVDVEDDGCDFPKPLPGDPAESPNGDNNCSGVVDPVDALLVLRFDAGLALDTGACPGLGVALPPGESALVWGDVDCSGSVSPVDALKVLRFDAGLEAEQTSWCPPIGS